VVDLTGASRRRRESALGWSLRLEAGNSFSPYGFVGACVGYLADGLFGVEAGVGTGLPGVQFGVAARKLFGEGGSYLATEVSLAANTKVARGRQTDIPQPTTTDQYVWTSLGAGFEQRTGRITLGFIASVAFTPSDANAHFGIHGGVGVLF
jgi:hypothetical protein